MCIQTRMMSLLLASSLVMGAQAHKNHFFDDVDDLFQEMNVRMQKRFDSMRQAMKTSFTTLDEKQVGPRLSIGESEDGHAVEIVVSHLDLKEKTFDANFDHEDQMLTITLPLGKLAIQNFGRYISVGFTIQKKQEKKDKEAESSGVMSMFTQTGRTVSAEVNLEEASIEYDEANSSLLIILPMKKKPTTKIPVTMKKQGQVQEK